MQKAIEIPQAGSIIIKKVDGVKHEAVFLTRTLQQRPMFIEGSRAYVTAQACLHAGQINKVYRLSSHGTFCPVLI